MDDVGKLDGVADEDHRDVVAHEVPVADLGVELDREPTRITIALGGVPAADDRGEAQRDVGALPLFLEEFGARVAADRLVAPLAVGLEVAVRGRASRVHHPLGDAFPVEVADLLQELVVLQRGGPTLTDRSLALVVVDRVALTVGQHLSVVPRCVSLVGCVGHATRSPKRVVTYVYSPPTCPEGTV